ncbi:helix-turn-helix domain-containing protein [Streptomyces profundus]|nr:helix-turn-helix domain-containing protein [Streptomyces sp. MA3_2.13]
MVVGRELRRLRDAALLSQKNAASLLGISTYILSRNETGETPCKRETLLKACGIYNATPEEQALLSHMLSEASRRRWWQGSEWRGVAQKKLLTLISLEEQAEYIRVYDRDRIPGMLQTEEYAHWAISVGMGGGSERDIRRRVNLRMERQGHYAQSKGKHYTSVLDEATLIRGYGNPTVMRRQLEKLLELAEDRRYGLHIAELRKYNMPTGIGQTILFDFGQQILPTILYEERHESAFVCQEPEEVDERCKSFDRLLHASMSTIHTRRRIRDHLDRLTRKTHR